jgi:putative ABC transport system ATP-binding protein
MKNMSANGHVVYDFERFCMIHTRNLVKGYRNHEVETPVLINVNIDIGDGEYVAVAGPSGSGKSTLFNILGLLEQPDQGELFFMGREVSVLSDRYRIKLRRGHIGYVFRQFNLVDELTVAENIELPLLYLSLSRKQRKEMVNESLFRFKLDHIRKSFPRQLTGLQQQVTALARAAVFNPSLLLADEPTGNLNSTGGNEILELLSTINEAGTTVVVFTNSMQDAQKTQRIIQLFDGHVVTDMGQKGN